jgi:ribose transport system permease protein
MTTVPSARTGGPTAAGKTSAGSYLVTALERGGVPIFLILLIVLFAVLPTTGSVFVSSANINSVLANQSVVGIIAIAMVVPLVAGYFDLSVPAIAGLSNVGVAALVATYQMPIAAGICFGLIIGLVAGIVNGLLVAYLRLSPFIATLGTYILIGGLLQLYTGGRTIIDGMPPGLGAWGSGFFIGLPRPLWVFLVIAFVVWFLLAQTPYGRKLAAIGSSERAANLAGIPVNRAVFLAYIVSGVLGGVAGIVLTIRNGSGDAGSAISYLFPAFAALFLGQTAIKPGYPNVWGTVFGVFLVAVAVNGLTLFGALGWASQVFNGAALLLSVAVAATMARVRERRAKAEQYATIAGDRSTPVLDEST